MPSVLAFKPVKACRRYYVPLIRLFIRYIKNGKSENLDLNNYKRTTFRNCCWLPCCCNVDDIIATDVGILAAVEC